MHAIRLHEFGPAENLRYEEVVDPQPGPGQFPIALETRATMGKAVLFP
jgi:NADPH2:quinone reductase